MIGILVGSRVAVDAQWEKNLFFLHNLLVKSNFLQTKVKIVPTFLVSAERDHQQEKGCSRSRSRWAGRRRRRRGSSHSGLWRWCRSHHRLTIPFHSGDVSRSTPWSSTHRGRCQNPVSIYLQIYANYRMLTPAPMSGKWYYPPTM